MNANRRVGYRIPPKQVTETENKSHAHAKSRAQQVRLLLTDRV